MERVKRGMLECIWGNQDPGTNAAGGQCCVLHPSFTFIILFVYIFQYAPQRNAGGHSSVGEPLEATVGWRATLSIFLFLQLFVW